MNLLTFVLDLKANLARAVALERSISSRKNGRASLEERLNGVMAYPPQKWSDCIV